MYTAKLAGEPEGEHTQDDDVGGGGCDMAIASLLHCQQVIHTINITSM